MRRQSNYGCDRTGSNAKNALPTEVAEAAPALQRMTLFMIRGVAAVAKSNLFSFSLSLI